MRKINAWLYVRLDSVIEAPEKWVIADDDMFGAIEADYAKSDALLLSRRTYETFAASWPERGSEVPNADWMNNTRKYVASTTLEAPDWSNSTVIEGDVAEAVARLKQEDGKDIMVNGSGALVWTLMPDHLLDELRSSCTQSSWAPGSGCSTTQAIPWSSRSSTRTPTTTGWSPSPTSRRAPRTPTRLFERLSPCWVRTRRANDGQQRA
jgi:dihydrofolate reductase